MSKTHILLTTVDDHTLYLSKDKVNFTQNTKDDKKVYAFVSDECGWDVIESIETIIQRIG